MSKGLLDLCRWFHTSESDGTGKSTLEKGGRDPDKTLDQIADDLLSDFKDWESFNKAEENIKMKYDIKMEHEHNCWPEDDIKRALGEIQRMDKNSDKRKDWSVVIILQMVKRSFVCGECKLQAAQENRNARTDEQGCETTPSLKGNSNASQNNAELETVGAAGGLIQPSGPKRTTSSPYRAPDSQDRPGEAIYIQGCETTPSLKGNSNASQNNAELETVGAAGGLIQPSGPKQTTSSPYRAHDSQDRPGEAIYIHIPFHVMLCNELHIQELPIQEAQPVVSQYKLRSGSPSPINETLMKRKSYTMSINNETRQIKWVYEILNKTTLADNCVRQKEFGNPYHRGHLAADRNHKWCREAFSDANLNINLVPQHKTLNKGPWIMAENRCRDLTNGGNNVHVYTGPLYINDESGQMGYGVREGKLVPTYFFKVIIVEKDDGTVLKPECYLMPNQNPAHSDLEKYIVDINDLQSLSGLTFIERRPNVSQMDRKISLTCYGDDVNAQSSHANIVVRILI
ncbi:hypothetical protein R3I93_002398 [Phoxinus phoxinus]|uniref:Uncharacterized protein n=1 Tax=Phoxinus phoxinus TaxID=58324 RepID=A0AAN9DKJ5_9TELE